MDYNSLAPWHKLCCVLAQYEKVCALAQDVVCLGARQRCTSQEFLEVLDLGTDFVVCPSLLRYYLILYWWTWFAPICFWNKHHKSLVYHFYWHYAFKEILDKLCNIWTNHCPWFLKNSPLKPSRLGAFYELSNDTICSISNADGVGL